MTESIVYQTQIGTPIDCLALIKAASKYIRSQRYNALAGRNNACATSPEERAKWSMVGVISAIDGAEAMKAIEDIVDLPPINPNLPYELIRCVESQDSDASPAP